MRFEYTPKGVCARKIELDIENGIVTGVSFSGGCNGNLKGIAALAEGKPAADVIDALSGIRCGFKSTSCPDQFARALKIAMEEEI